MKKLLFVSNITNKVTNFSLSSILASQKLGYEFHLAANLENFQDDISKYNIKLHHIDFNRNPFNKRNFNAYKQLATLVRTENFDVIHCNTPIGGGIGRLVGKKYNTPKIIYTAHGFHFYKGASLTNNIVFKPIERYLAKRTDTIITMNNEDYKAAKAFKLRDNGRVYYVPGVGVDTELFANEGKNNDDKRKELGIKPTDTLLISMGDLIPRKNYKISIKAMSLLQESSIKLIICGEGPLKDELKDYARSLNIEEQIHFLGYRNDIKDLLSASDIFLFTTLQEGLPRSMMEAMAAGLPCVASEIRGNVDLINNGVGGYLCKPDDAESFANAIDKLTKDSEIREDMSKVNKHVIKEFDFSNVKQKMQGIYDMELS